MKQVGITELKARLSEYLRAVRNGETITVTDRETPVAQIVPLRDKNALSEAISGKRRACRIRLLFILAGGGGVVVLAPGGDLAADEVDDDCVV